MSPLRSGHRGLGKDFASNRTGSGFLSCVLLKQRARIIPYTTQMNTYSRNVTFPRDSALSLHRPKPSGSWICRALPPSRCFHDRLEKEVGSSPFSCQDGQQGSTVMESPKTIRLFVLVSRGSLGDFHRLSGRLSQEPCQMQSRASKRSSLVQVKRRGPWGWTSPCTENRRRFAQHVARRPGHAGWRSQHRVPPIFFARSDVVMRPIYCLLCMSSICMPRKTYDRDAHQVRRHDQSECRLLGDARSDCGRALMARQRGALVASP
jgi:hypothetical protein